MYSLHAFLKVCWNYLLLTLAHLNHPLPSFPASSFSPSHAFPIGTLPHSIQSPLQMITFLLLSSWFSSSSQHSASVFFLQPLHPSSYVTVFFLAHPGPFSIWSLNNHFNYTSVPLQLPPIRYLHVFPSWTTRFLIGREYVLVTTESPSPSSVPGT